MISPENGSAEPLQAWPKKAAPTPYLAAPSTPAQPAQSPSFTGLGPERIVAPGLVKLHVSTSSTDDVHANELILHGKRNVVGLERELLTPVTVIPLP